MIEFILERPIEEALELPTYVFRLDHIPIVRGKSLSLVPRLSRDVIFVAGRPPGEGKQAEGASRNSLQKLPRRKHCPEAYLAMVWLATPEV